MKKEPDSLIRLPAPLLARGPPVAWPVGGLLGQLYFKENKFKMVDDTDSSVLGEEGHSDPLR